MDQGVERRPEPTANSGGPRRQGWRAVARPSRHVPHAAAAGEAEQIGRRREAHDRSGRVHRDDRGQLGGVPGRPKAARLATSGGHRGATAAPLLRPGGEGAPLGWPPCAGGGALERWGGRMGCCEQGPVRPLLRATAVWTCRGTYPRAQARGGRPAAPLRTRGAAHPCCSSADRARRRSRRTAGCRAVGVGLGLKGNGGGGGAVAGVWFAELGWRARQAGVRVTGRAAMAGGVTCRPPPAASSRPWRRSGRGRD